MWYRYVEEKKALAEMVATDVARYKAEGFRGRGLPDTGLFLRRHDARGAAFSALWAHELLSSPFGRDQISYPYVVGLYTLNFVVDPWRLVATLGGTYKVISWFCKRCLQIPNCTATPRRG